MCYPNQRTQFYGNQSEHPCWGIHYFELGLTFSLLNAYQFCAYPKKVNMSTLHIGFLRLTCCELRYPLSDMRSRQKIACSLLLATMLTVNFVLAGADFQRLHQLALERHGQEAAETVTQWRALLTGLEDQPIEEKLNKVNDFFNSRIRFADDMNTWGKKDYWATPLETMGRRQGDCEDFSIAKYATLLLAGIAPEKLQITYVKARSGDYSSTLSRAHMILAYYETPEAEPVVLDNIVQEIRPASQRDDLTPVYAFNSQGLWVGGLQQAVSSNPGLKLSRWSDLLQRMNQDGLQ